VLLSSMRERRTYSELPSEAIVYELIMRFRYGRHKNLPGIRHWPLHRGGLIFTDAVAQHQVPKLTDARERGKLLIYEASHASNAKLALRILHPTMDNDPLKEESRRLLNPRRLLNFLKGGTGRYFAVDFSAVPHFQTVNAPTRARIIR
jgi:hypothetical protein